MLTNLTQEERLALREKAVASRASKKKAGECLKQDWVDLPVWKQLASEAGIRLPQSHIPSSEIKHLKKALKKLNVDPKEWCDVQGYKTLKGFSKDNPEANAVLEVGLLLEYCSESKENVD